MLPGTHTAIVNELVEKLKLFLDNPDLTWSVVDGETPFLRVPTVSPEVRVFLEDPVHGFKPDEKLKDFYFLPDRWRAVRIRDYKSMYGRATAVIDPQQRVRLIVMFNQENEPAPVELIG